MYLKPHSMPPGLAPGQSMKRQRTPSPPRHTIATLPSGHYRTIPITAHGRTSYAHQPHGAAYVTAMSPYHVPGPSSASSSRDDERKQPLYLAHQTVRYGSEKSDRDRDRGRLAVAPPAHVQPIALTTTRAGTELYLKLYKTKGLKSREGCDDPIRDD